ncbi:MAG TPA: hypothetical protein VGB26_01145, partial [Nitrospiria bacterium]
KRRIIGPVSACVLDSSSNQDPVKKGTGYFFLLDVCQPYRIPAFAGMMGRAWISAFPCLQVLAGQAANDKIYPLTSTMSLKFKLKSFSLTEEYRKKYHGFISPDLLSH